MTCSVSTASTPRSLAVTRQWLFSRVGTQICPLEARRTADGPITASAGSWACGNSEIPAELRERQGAGEACLAATGLTPFEANHGAAPVTLSGNRDAQNANEFPWIPVSL